MWRQMYCGLCTAESPQKNCCQCVCAFCAFPFLPSLGFGSPLLLVLRRRPLGAGGGGDRGAGISSAASIADPPPSAAPPASSAGGGDRGAGAFPASNAANPPAAGARAGVGSISVISAPTPPCVSPVCCQYSPVFWGFCVLRVPCGWVHRAF